MGLGKKGRHSCLETNSEMRIYSGINEKRPRSTQIEGELAKAIFC